MRVRRHTAALLITSAVFAAGLVAPADAKPGNGNANGHQKLHCRAFHASGVGVDDGMGTTSAVLTRGNREIATTLGTFTVTGVDAQGVASFTGTIVATFDAGTLSAPVDGSLDTVSGEFRATSDSVTGTDGLADVTGRLTFAGVEDLAGLTFTETVHGKLCVPKKKQH
ncbi:MAG: hypothetical protein ABIO83_10455 [Ilumatobacteraceae bacterium]